MFKPFIFTNNKFHLNEPSILLVKEFAELWESDRSSEKDYCFKVFKFVYLMEDLRSILRELSETDRLVKALSSSGLSDSDLNKPLVRSVIRAYKELVEKQRKVRVLKSMLHSVDQMAEFFSTINFREKATEGQSKGRFQHDISKHVTVLKQASSLLGQVTELEEQLEKELEAVGVEERIRGNAKQSKLMKEALNHQKNG